MDTRTQLIFVVVFAVVGSAVAKTIPSYVHVCKASDPEYSKCLLETIDSVRPKLANGISKLRIPALEPLVVPAMEFSANMEGVKGKLRVNDVNVHGGSNFIINYLYVNPKTMTANVSLTLPQLSGHARYEVDTRLAGFRLKSQGFGKGNFTNIQADVYGSAKIKTTNGIRHFIIDKLSSNIKFLGGASLKLTSSSAQDTALVNAFNVFFQENQKEIIQVLSPVVNETTDDVIRQVFDSLFSTLPVEEILPA